MFTAVKRKSRLFAHLLSLNNRIYLNFSSFKECMYELIIKQIMGATEGFNARRRVQHARQSTVMVWCLSVLHILQTRGISL